MSLLSDHSVFVFCALVRLTYLGPGGSAVCGSGYIPAQVQGYFQAFCLLALFITLFGED